MSKHRWSLSSKTYFVPEELLSIVLVLILLNLKTFLLKVSTDPNFDYYIRL